MEPIFIYLNNNKIFAGCAMMLMNIGSRYISYDIPKSIDTIFENVWIRRIVIFCIAFIATHDVKISILITLIFILLMTILLNEKSKGCILPKKYMDFNKDGVVTKDEFEKAKNILEKYYSQSK